MTAEDRKAIFAAACAAGMLAMCADPGVDKAPDGDWLARRAYDYAEELERERAYRLATKLPPRGTDE